MARTAVLVIRVRFEFTMDSLDDIGSLDFSQCQECVEIVETRGLLTIRFIWCARKRLFFDLETKFSIIKVIKMIMNFTRADGNRRVSNRKIQLAHTFGFAYCCPDCFGHRRRKPGPALAIDHA